MEVFGIYINIDEEDVLEKNFFKFFIVMFINCYGK